MFSICYQCQSCRKENIQTLTTLESLYCTACDTVHGTLSEEFIFDFCPVCQCKEFYKQKDFNRSLGCFVMLVAIILVPWTYGLSLPLFCLVDWWLYRRVPDMAVCYLCQAEFRGTTLPPKVRSFNHAMAEGFEKKRYARSKRGTIK